MPELLRLWRNGDMLQLRTLLNHAPELSEILRIRLTSECALNRSEARGLLQVSLISRHIELVCALRDIASL